MATAKAGCRKIRFRKSNNHHANGRNDTVEIFVHDKLVAGPITAANMSLSKGLASEEAMSTLMNPASDLSLKLICNCMQSDLMAGDALADIRTEDMNDEDEVDFNILGQIHLDTTERGVSVGAMPGNGEPLETDDELEELERQEVELMMREDAYFDFSGI